MIVPFMVSITHLKIKQLPLANGHGHYTTVTPERAGVRWGIAATHQGPRSKTDPPGILYIFL
jgi:hypothetical protein